MTTSLILHRVKSETRQVRYHPEPFRAHKPYWSIALRFEQEDEAKVEVSIFTEDRRVALAYAPEKDWEVCD